jgi:uroporphyrinogen-III synthase
VIRVLLTRPRDDAERTARRLAARGYVPILCPVTEVVATGEPMPAGTFDAMVLTSAHAVPALSAATRLQAPIFAVGERTAARLRQAGFADVKIGPGDAAGLAALIAGSLPVESKLLHIAGRHRKAEPAASLRAHGFAVAVWEVYEARAVATLPDTLGAGRIDVVLHYSRRSAALLADLAEAAGLGSIVRDATHLCLSEDAAVPLAAVGATVLVAAEPVERALLAALDTYAERSPCRASSRP